MGVKLAKHGIAASYEAVPHLLWFYPQTRLFLDRIFSYLQLLFLGQRFGKFFWLFGRFRLQCPNTLFLFIGSVLGTVDYMDTT